MKFILFMIVCYSAARWLVMHLPGPWALIGLALNFLPAFVYHKTRL